MASFVVPPGGFAGFSQMTPTSKASLFPSGRGTSGRRSRRTTKKTRTKTTKRAKRSGGRKPKFGSPAWRKMYMKKR